MLTHHLYKFNQFQRNQWVAKQAAQISPNLTVLDIGAGSCPYRNLFAHCQYKTHDFIQLSPEQLLGKKGYGAIDYVSDISSIPVDDASFDVILCTEVLEHVPEPIKAVHEFARILKPGGKLLLTAPLGSGLHQEPYHFYGGYTPYWYQHFLAEAGFKTIVVDPNGGFFRHYSQEGFRFVTMLAPWSNKKKFIWLPVWLLTLPWLLIINPFLSQFLDNLDSHKGFTVGYHISAIRV